ncbi:G-type lectin S-receptor-like serine/threonine-protein kinase At1g11330 isoform X2 [Magnolia sinica]|uniref:G-type lectin S-receptor-like serine/threonine-protein kinase At1g11330 isoform X2 n=1 Tax=Magnolia sinica TaxID=86752 RepID=UPI0026589F2D|nr:G-type lectin S-receptor-like serine/threonine-protein kinase At1g11330 isoform X2 [Magnolia sinica]
MGWPFSSVSWLIFSFLHLLTCTAEDRITLGQSIGANQTITSSNDLFALGFFSPHNSTNRYVGIWYNQIPNQTVVWVANKEKPLTDSNGVLTITDDGNLVVMDGYRKILWSSKVTMVIENSIMAVLMDTGNLILRRTDQMVVWQSFDSPLGSFLPGMRVSLNKKTGENIRLLSWKDENDPDIGRYSYGIDPRTPRQLIIWKGPDVYMRSAVWQEVTVFSRLEGDRQFVGYTAVVGNNNEISVQLTISDNSIMLRFVLTPTGLFQMQAWRENSKEWQILSSFPTNECDLYAKCGPFASCDNSSSPSMCKCLKGFQPKIQRDWDSRNWSGGCVRQKQLNCEKADEFLKVERTKLPDFSISTAGNVSRRECELICLRNCSCSAFAYNNASDWGDWKCVIWVGDLIDLVGNRVGTVELYVRRAVAELGKDGQVIGSSKARSLLAILLSSAAAAMLLLGTSGYLLWRRRRTKGWRETNKAFPMHGFISAETQYEGHNMLQSGTNISELPLVDFDCIIAATDNFSPENKLGVGGFGSVYKGNFLAQEVAVKRLSKSSGQGLEEFKNEVELIAKLQHRNLVKLLGWCIYGEEKILIYEYMPNNSLDKYLFDPSRQPHLDWGVRFRIVEGIAQGLLYLHRYSRLRVIHRDLKASNILLDGEMNPKISDFGLARIFGGNQTRGNTGRVVGTLHGNCGMKKGDWS